MQSRLWGELKGRFGWRATRMVLLADGRPVSGAQILCRRLPWGQWLAYVPKGPIVDWTDRPMAQATLEAVEQAARRSGAAVVIVEPDVQDDASLATWLRSLDWRPTRPVQPRSTIVIDLADDEALMAQMKPKWRYNIRLAERRGVTVREGTEEDLPAIYELMKETAQRDGFAIHVRDYYETAYRLFAPGQRAVWLLAEHEGRLLAAIVVFAHGERAWYFWGASSTHGRQVMPNHALQWAAMRWARERGCRRYDLWGIPDEVGCDPDAITAEDLRRGDGLWGVFRFKQGFGGQVVRFVGAWEKPISPLGYALYRLGMRWRGRSE